MSLTPLGPGAEFDVIRRILKEAAPPGEPVVLAAGDDCALLEAGDCYLAVSVDLFVEGAHFRSEWGGPERVGRRATLSALSDLAAMAAQPVAVLVSIALPKEAGAELAERIGAACRTTAEENGASLIGGDLSRGGAALALDVTALGTVARPLLRGGVRPGDEIWVTGVLGAAAAAVQAWTAGQAAPEAWQERFWSPTPRWREARWLSERSATAAIDLSDGLLADAGHLAAASGVGIEIDLATVPAAAGVEAELALGGGEDYELLLAFPGDILSAEATQEFQRTFGAPLTRAGRAVAGVGVRVFHDGEEVELGSRGFDHFKPDISAT